MKPSKEMQEVRKASFNLWLAVFRWYAATSGGNVDAETELDFALGAVRLVQEEIINYLEKGFSLTEIREIMREANEPPTHA